MDTMFVGRQQWRILLIEGVKGGLIDKWEAWKQLYNAGWRGKDLNGWLR
jgi:hypothetical protein